MAIQFRLIGFASRDYYFASGLSSSLGPRQAPWGLQVAQWRPLSGLDAVQPVNESHQTAIDDPLGSLVERHWRHLALCLAR